MERPGKGHSVGSGNWSLICRNTAKCHAAKIKSSNRVEFWLVSVCLVELFSST